MSALIRVTLWKEGRDHLVLLLGLAALWSMADRWGFWLHLGAFALGYKLVADDLREGLLPSYFTRPVPRSRTLLIKLLAAAAWMTLTLFLHAAGREALQGALFRMPSLKWMSIVAGAPIGRWELWSLWMQSVYWAMAGAFFSAWSVSRWVWVWGFAYAAAAPMTVQWAAAWPPASEPWVLAAGALAWGAAALDLYRRREP